MSNHRKPSLLSLFTGAGGLDIGLQAAGFEVRGCVEKDEDARETIRQNYKWPLIEEPDLDQTPPAKLAAEIGIQSGQLDLLSGGPPCQPFSKSGQWQGIARMDDPRASTIVSYLDVVEELLPKVMLLENVMGIVSREPNKQHATHAIDTLEGRLERINLKHSTNYQPKVLCIDAANYGVPQHRQRAFVVACREGTDIEPPLPTHGDNGDPFVTAWDAIGDLGTCVVDPELKLTGKWAGLIPTIPEGMNYQYHTDRGDGLPLFGYRTRYWSFLLKLARGLPSWTIQAQPGPATGPFHWENRKLSVRELARLQTFPDSVEFRGSYRSAQKQIGNAVPAALAEAIGLHIRTSVLGQDVARTSDLSINHTEVALDPLNVAEVPREYLSLKGKHADHPGQGNGPGVSQPATLGS